MSASPSASRSTQTRWRLCSAGFEGQILEGALPALKDEPEEYALQRMLLERLHGRTSSVIGQCCSAALLGCNDTEQHINSSPEFSYLQQHDISIGQHVEHVLHPGGTF